MSKLLVCEGASLRWIHSTGGTGTANIIESTSVKSQKVKINGNKVYKKIGFSIEGVTIGDCTKCSGEGTIEPSGNRKVFIDEGEKPIIDSDQATKVELEGTKGSDVCIKIVTVKIDEAGQDIVKVSG